MTSERPPKYIHPSPMDITTLHRILAEAKKYGASYFTDAPMQRFVMWLESQLHETEAQLHSQEVSSD